MNKVVERDGEVDERAQQAEAGKQGDEDAFRAQANGNGLAAALDAGDLAEQGRGRDPAIGSGEVVPADQAGSLYAGR